MLHASCAQKTHEAYNQGMKCFEVFQMQFNFEKEWPPSLEQIVHFIGFMSAKGLSDATARTYNAGMSYKLKLQNYPDETQNFIVKKLLEGYKRSSKCKDTRFPITLDILHKIINALPNICTTVYEAKLFAAAYIVAFFGFFRVGEFTAIKENNLGHAIQHQDVTLLGKEKVVQINLKHSKTD